MSFPLYLDEDVDVEIARLMQRAGYDVLTTRDAGRAHRGIPDDDQLEFATLPGMAVVTYNVSDFYSMAREWPSQGRSHAGIVVMNRSRTLPQVVAGLIALQQMHPDGIPNLYLWLPIVRDA